MDLPPDFYFWSSNHRHKFIISEVISKSSKLHSSKLQISMIDIFDLFSVLSAQTSRWSSTHSIYAFHIVLFFVSLLSIQEKYQLCLTWNSSFVEIVISLSIPFQYRFDSWNAANIFESFESHSLFAPTSRPRCSNIKVIQLTFFASISHRSLFHILTFNPVGILIVCNL